MISSTRLHLLSKAATPASKTNPSIRLEARIGRLAGAILTVICVLWRHCTVVSLARFAPQESIA